MRSLPFHLAAVCLLARQSRGSTIKPQSRQFQRSVAQLSYRGARDLVDTETSRRAFGRRLGSSIAFNTAALGLQRGCWAAAPISQSETQNVGAQTRRFLRPKPRKLLRPKLDRDFAVLLMRSSYQALDELDCVAMDQFQRDFFLIRQAEYEPYVKSLGAGIVQQGDLTDPYYFDFISFAQYATINREIATDPPFVFTEQQPVDAPEGQPQKFASTVVRRGLSLTNDLLVGEHSRRVGEAVINKLDEIFGSTPSAIPTLRSSSDANDINVALTQLVKLFLVNGFAFGGDVLALEPAEDRIATYRITLRAPANLWGGIALEQQNGFRQAPLPNNYICQAALEMLRRAGFRMKFAKTTYKEDAEISEVAVFV